ncbi:aldo/keto reductase [Klugiella xanthotipulae]|uniref:2,5-diketo-D-gluconate reductase A n=1 Tax=Klugiella xanthotipulae TaxID=244735 RepID=A0A543HYH2_9MICO|nr:aldo/keto reductase [Klugiella xanthotipulae]TQM63295.1 2,5-diketo-D-gluconate reductase A [Klugiella xanthotipulae]
MAENTIPLCELSNGTRIPQLGFGVFLVDPPEAERVVSDALEVGYRHIDTATIYKNEEGVGRAIASSGIARDDLFVTTKLWNADQGADTTLPAFEASLDRLGLDYVDLYLIHWPAPARDAYVDSWRVLERIEKSGRAKAIGVSNFLIPHLDRLIDETGVIPAVNQIELHPYHQRRELVEFCQGNDIRVEAWGPLSQGKSDLLENPVIVAAAAAHGKSSAQVVLRWHLEQGNIIFPKTTRRERAIENLDLFTFELSSEERSAITALDRELRLGGDPLEVN